MSDIEQKLQELDELRAQRKDIDEKIAALFGLRDETETTVALYEGVRAAIRDNVKDGRPGQRQCSNCHETGHIARKCPNAAPKGSRVVARGMPKPCCGSMGPRHKANCPGVARKDARTLLHPDIYEGVRDAMHDKEFQSARFALTHNLSPIEVNRALVSRTYEEYTRDL